MSKNASGPADASAFVDIPSKYISSSFKHNNKTCPTGQNQWRGYNTSRQFGNDTTPVDTFVCSIHFNIPDNLDPPVLFYYRLTNFYQNHRRYVKSLDSDQLKGTAVKNGSLGECNPLDTDESGRAYYPCGLIANSLFNDSFTNPVQLNVHDANLNNRTYNMTDKGISWASDKELYGQTKYKIEDIAVPPNWQLRYQNNYTQDNPPPNLKEDEGFQVWMRTAGLPAFSKLAKRNDNETMECSSYEVEIDDSKYIWNQGLPSITHDDRFHRHQIWRYKVNNFIHANGDGRKESIPRNRICRGRRHMHRPRNHLHYHTFDQTKVCYPSQQLWRLIFHNSNDLDPRHSSQVNRANVFVVGNSVTILT